MQWRWYLVLALALAQPCAAADAPTIRPLDSEPETAPPAEPDGAPARTLPPTITVCHDPATHRCWTAAHAEDCARDKGQVYRVVLGDETDRDAVTAIRQCRTAVAPAR